MKKKFRSFKDARKFAQTLKIQNQNDWRIYAKSGKLPDYIPRDPPSVYKNEWKGWSDFFGNELRYLKNPPTIEEYKKWLQKIGVKSENELRTLPKSKFPKDYPKGPEGHYKRQGTWKGWSDFFGNEPRFLKNPPTYEKYKKWIQSMGIKSENKFKKLASSKFPKNYPKDPAGHYKRQGTWKGWSDFFGNESQHLENPPSIEEYKKWIHTIGIKSQTEFRKLPRSKFPKDYPKDPSNHYGKQGTWKGWGNILGTGNIAFQNREYLPWKEAKPLYKKIKIENNLKNSKDWEKYAKTHRLPNGLPPDPNRIYTEERVRKMMK